MDRTIRKEESQWADEWEKGGKLFPKCPLIKKHTCGSIMACWMSACEVKCCLRSQNVAQNWQVADVCVVIGVNIIEL